MLALDANSVPVLYRIRATTNGEQIADTTAYMTPAELSSARSEIMSALRGAYPGEKIGLDIFPA